MAKEFKNYDKMFKKGSDSDLSHHDLVEARKIVRWEHPVNQHSMDVIRAAVYYADDHLNWQQFRVSLKGQSTQVKLWRLDRKFRLAQQLGFHEDIVRVDNYIGALKRGGQLNAAGEIIK